MSTQWVTSRIPRSLPEIERPPLSQLARFILIGILLACLLLGVLVARPGGSMLPALLLGIPVVVAIARSPFYGLVLWVAVAPFVSIRGSAMLNMLHLGIHRLLILFLFTVLVLALVAKRDSLKIGWPEVLLGGYAVYTMVSLYVTSEALRADAVSYFDRILAPVLVFFLAKHLIDRPERFRVVAAAMLFVVLAQGGLSLLAEFTPLKSALPPQWFNRADRVTGSLGNPVVYGSSMLMMIVIVMHSARHMPALRTGILPKVAYVLGGISIALTFSRSVWLAVVIVMILSMVVQRHAFKSIVPLAALTLLVLFSGPLTSQLEYARERLNNENTLYGRIEKLQASMNMVEDRPLFGFGYLEINEYFEEYLRQIPNLTESATGVSHHTFLTMLIELGFVGFLLYALPIAIIVVRSIRAAPYLPRSGLWSRELLATLWVALVVVFWVSNTMDMRFFAYPVTLTWLLLGVIAALIEQGRKVRDEVNEGRAANV